MQRLKPYLWRLKATPEEDEADLDILDRLLSQELKDEIYNELKPLLDNAAETAKTETYDKIIKAAQKNLPEGDPMREAIEGVKTGPTT